MRVESFQVNTPTPKTSKWLQTFLLRLYALALKLYPSAFRAAFADEMRDVFAMSLRGANNHAALWIVGREIATLPLNLITAHRQAFHQLSMRQQRRQKNAWFVRIMGGLLSLFLLSTLRVILSPAYGLYTQAMPFVAALFVACICLLIGLVWGRIGGLLSIASGAAVGSCMSLYVYKMGFDQMGLFGTIFIGLIWALPFLIFGLLFYELSKPPKHLLPA